MILAPGFVYALCTLIVLGAGAVVGLEIERVRRRRRVRLLRDIADVHGHTQLGQIASERIADFEAAATEYDRLVVVLLLTLTALSTFLVAQAVA